jgi:hypothetical protein
MKNPTLKNWKYNKELVGLIIFAQCMEEMLFDYTLDTYKSPAMNTLTLCWEGKYLISQLKSEKISSSNIDPIIEELIWSINNDNVAKAILYPRHEPIINSLSSSKGNIDNLIKWLNTTQRYITSERYYQENKKQLIEVVKDPKRKREILKLTRSFLTEILNRGYNQSHIYFELKKFFFEKHEINGAYQLEEFLNLFTFQDLKWEVLFIVDDSFLNIKRFLEKLKMEIYANYILKSPNNRVEKTFVEKCKPGQAFLKLKVDAKDPYRARERAEVTIDILSKLCGFYAHHKQSYWKKRCIVYDTQDKVLPIGPSVNPMTKRPNKSLDDTGKFVEMVLSRKGLKQSSYISVMKVIDMHGSALKSTSSENQLLNLWSSVEAMFPVPKNEKSRINYIIKCLLPILRKTYTHKVLNNLYKGVLSCCDESLIGLDKIHGKSNFLKFVALVCLKENEEQRKLLYSLIDKNPLLKNRIYEIFCNYSNAKSIKKMLDLHSTRVKWQIHRIYRSRNLIVHSAESLPYLQTLVENLHGYVDIVMNYLQDLIVEGNMFNSFEELALEAEIDVGLHNKILESKKDSDCNYENYMLLLFGYNKVL